MAAAMMSARKQAPVEVADGWGEIAAVFSRLGAKRVTIRTVQRWYERYGFRLQKRPAKLDGRGRNCGRVWAYVSDLESFWRRFSRPLSNLRLV